MTFFKTSRLHRNCTTKTLNPHGSLNGKIYNRRYPRKRNLSLPRVVFGLAIVCNSLLLVSFLKFKAIIDEDESSFSAHKRSLFVSSRESDKPKSKSKSQVDNKVASSTKTEFAKEEEKAFVRKSVSPKGIVQNKTIVENATHTGTKTLDTNKMNVKTAWTTKNIAKKVASNTTQPNNVATNMTNVSTALTIDIAEKLALAIDTAEKAAVMNSIQSQERSSRETKPIREINTTKHSKKTIVPFVLMVHKRLTYLKSAVNSIRKSDFPKDTAPLIISHDGHVPEMMEYVDSLKSEFNIVQLFHPFACFDHPNTWPGDDPTLNDGYKGDAYGNPRESWTTCCKHHFTWLMARVFSMTFNDNTIVENFLFLEEDYIVAPTVYSTIISGLNAMEQFQNETLGGGFVGVGLDITDAGMRGAPSYVDQDAFMAQLFRTGPMTLSRSIFEKLKAHATDYCEFDEYNWDWSFVHCAGLGYIPHTMLYPTKAQVKHIGFEGGMHSAQLKQGSRMRGMNHTEETFTVRFEGKSLYGSVHVGRIPHNVGNGGWGHPIDRLHCMNLLTVGPFYNISLLGDYKNSASRSKLTGTSNHNASGNNTSSSKETTETKGTKTNRE